MEVRGWDVSVRGSEKRVFSRGYKGHSAATGRGPTDRLPPIERPLNAPVIPFPPATLPILYLSTLKAVSQPLPHPLP